MAFSTVYYVLETTGLQVFCEFTQTRGDMTKSQDAVWGAIRRGDSDIARRWNEVLGWLANKRRILFRSTACPRPNPSPHDPRRPSIPFTTFLGLWSRAIAGTKC